MLLCGYKIITESKGKNMKNIQESKITDVTVFLSGAQVTRRMNVMLEEGIHTVVVDNLSQTLQVESLQVASDDATILSIEYALDYMIETDPIAVHQKLQRII